MKIHTSTSEDLREIFRLYGLATEYQKTIYPKNTWPSFERELVETEIQEQRQFKMVVENQIACVWAITFADPQIWEERDKDPSIYIHRIATNPDFRGRQYVKEIVEWARGYAESNQKRFIRLDTCGNNQKLIKHYTSCGFDFLEIVRLTNTDALPGHYQGADVCLFEIKLNVG
ncbi:GNAT family N-acetyltransferase [Maribacter algarum]|uniref:GNAT family N-acetyltransferase n=1 Tax=Maribacter algarum (ex Zhang et al. 2020) TaxID=2578118 RepID=A0A5S3PP08_9FLAO|nr:GNAT family N-acetyltransferase [Maribacter algarum]TMM56101.1 GNAT family N-acetyltransferase [Maribacter algarum]